MNGRALLAGVATRPRLSRPSGDPGRALARAARRTSLLPVTIFILDEIVVKPGLLRAYRCAYRSRYMPSAKRRGMILEDAWQSPAGRDYDDLPVTLFYLWSVADTSAWWAMRLSRTEDGLDERSEKLAWWRESDGMTLSRTRRTLTRQPAEG